MNRLNKIKVCCFPIKYILSISEGYQIIALDSIVVKTQNCLHAQMIPNYWNVLTQRNSLIKLLYYDENRKELMTQR